MDSYVNQNLESIICKAESAKKLNLQIRIYNAESAKQNLQNRIYKAESAKQILQSRICRKKQLTQNPVITQEICNPINLQSMSRI